MRLQRAAWAAFLALAFSWTCMAQEPVKLEYRLLPGTELIYKTTGKMTGVLPAPNGEVAAEISGTERFVVADVDAARRDAHWPVAGNDLLDEG